MLTTEVVEDSLSEMPFLKLMNTEMEEYIKQTVL